MNIDFHSPQFDEYVKFLAAKSQVICEYFQYKLRVFGADPAQTFFLLPEAVTSYLIGKRRFGFETWWLEKGDLDSTNFWTYPP